MKLNSVFRTMILSALLFVGIAAEARVISGVVKDATGETIISASIVVKGTSIGTVTDFDGTTGWTSVSTWCSGGGRTSR